MAHKFLKKFESFNPIGIVFGTTDFEITYDELSDLLIDITDEFPDIEWFVESSKNSNIINMCKNSFIITLVSKSINDEWGSERSIAYIEPGIYKIIKNINSHLAAYNLYISRNDFPKYLENEYEIVISKIGKEPVDKKMLFESVEKDDDIIYLDFDENMMVNTSYVINLIPINDDAFIGRLVFTLKNTLSEKTYKKLFNYIPRNPRDFLILFITTIIDDTILYKISNKVVIHEGSDYEDEYALALEIDNRLVLLLHSPDRGSSIRIQDDNYSIKKEEVVEVLKGICEILNKKI